MKLNLSLRLIAGLSTALLFLLIVFASHYQIELEQLEEHTGVLELMAATLPLLSLLLAAAFSTPPGKRKKNKSSQLQRRSGASAHR